MAWAVHDVSFFSPYRPRLARSSKEFLCTCHLAPGPTNPFRCRASPLPPLSSPPKPLPHTCVSYLSATCSGDRMCSSTTYAPTLRQV